nr:plant UBX domain-containing protein 8-like isoform X2 [Ipomoea batatas]
MTTRMDSIDGTLAKMSELLFSLHGKHSVDSSVSPVALSGGSSSDTTNSTPVPSVPLQHCLESRAVLAASRVGKHSKILSFTSTGSSLMKSLLASGSQEPTPDDENAVNLVVRMSDGTRGGRQFLKSDRLCSTSVKGHYFRRKTSVRTSFDLRDASKNSSS